MAKNDLPAAGLKELPKDAPRQDKPTLAAPAGPRRYRVKHPLTGALVVTAPDAADALRQWAERFFPTQAGDAEWLALAAQGCRVAELVKSKVTP